jgi:hypothetical protein
MNRMKSRKTRVRGRVSTPRSGTTARDRVLGPFTDGNRPIRPGRRHRRLRPAGSTPAGSWWRAARRYRHGLHPGPASRSDPRKHDGGSAGRPHASMTVRQAADGMPIEREHLYVIPPGTYLSVGDGALRLSQPQARHGARLPFDFLLHSLAEEYGGARRLRGPVGHRGRRQPRAEGDQGKGRPRHRAGPGRGRL